MIFHHFFVLVWLRESALLRLFSSAGFFLSVQQPHIVLYESLAFARKRRKDVREIRIWHASSPSRACPSSFPSDPQRQMSWGSGFPPALSLTSSVCFQSAGASSASFGGSEWIRLALKNRMENALPARHLRVSATSAFSQASAIIRAPLCASEGKAKLSRWKTTGKAP